MPTYTFAPAPVLVEATGEFAIGATGTLASSSGGAAVSTWDLNGSPLASILVGPKGAHQAFKADIPHGVLNFGSVQIVAISVEAQQAAITAQETADQAVADAQSALAQVQQLVSQIGNGRGLVTLPAGTDPPETTVDYTVIFEYHPPTGTPTSVESAG